MKKKRSIKTVIILVCTGAIVIGGGAAGVIYYRNTHGSTVEVVSVASINQAEWISYDYDEGTSGTVVSDVSQKVQVPEDKVIDEVFVQEGDKVKIGDKLLTYDKTLLELDQELQELTVQELELELKSAEKDLAKLKNTTPSAYSASQEEADDSGSSALDDASGEQDDSGDEEARLMTNSRVLLASQQQGTAEDADVQEVAESETSAGDTETVETQSTESQADDENGETEELIDNGITEKLTGEELGDLPNSAAAEDTEGETEEADAEKEKKNQSLKGFLTNLRVKSVEETGETLLADTVNGNGPQIQATESLKLIPHFHETTEAVFVEDGTYTLLISGITLKEDLQGKIYGIAVINGEDYPEIGGFTLVQRTDLEQTAQLTLAFHDGLTTEHEKAETLEDMYVELPVTAQELTGGTLSLVVSDDSQDNLFVEIQKPETESAEETESPDLTTEASGQETESEVTAETESGSETESEVTTGTENEDESESEVTPETESEGESESEVTPETESGGETDAEEETESETETEIEPESQDETEEETEDESEIVTAESGTLHYLVKWEHGTNSEYNWPAALKVYFYKNADDAEPVWTEDLMQKSSAADGGTGSETGDSAAEEEETTETTATEASTESEESTSSESETDAQTTTETEASEPADTIEDPDDPYPTETVTWSVIDAEWPSDAELSFADIWNEEKTYIWAYAENYTPAIIRDPASGTITITMTYQEPAESPLEKLNPIEELTYQHGANTLSGTGLRAYKGSGTAEDPYLFFVKDGVTIRNTFVNWVMGFNEDGTERISDGYYVRLEIRESDTITGAFIRSIDLDGTVLTETGYGPGTYWIFNSETGISRYEEEVPEDSDTPGDDPGWSDDNTGTYTAEELAEAIEDKELEIKKLNLDIKEAELKLKQYNQELEDCTVVSAVDGYVQSLDAGSDEAYMVVASENGLYVKTTVSELELDSIETGQEITCTSWETGLEFTATITNIERFPESSDSDYYYYSSSENVNSSNYPVLAVISDESAEVSEYESISVKYTSAQDQTTGSIYLEKAYIRSENGQSYVYIADENGKLKKQYIRTGGNSYGYIEVRQGLSDDDLIAFPYGTSVKEGAATKNTEEDEY